MAYMHRLRRRRRRRGQKGGFLGMIPTLIAALAPTVAGAVLSQVGKGGTATIVARRRRKYRNRP